MPSIPMSTAAIMPSPAMLWRFKVLLLCVWGFICCKVGWDSVMRMSVDLRDLFLYEAFLYYNPLLLVTMMVWFWGVNLWFFAQGNVNYAKIFDLDQNHLIHREIWKCATWPPKVSPTISLQMSTLSPANPKSQSEQLNQNLGDGDGSRATDMGDSEEEQLFSCEGVREEPRRRSVHQGAQQPPQSPPPKPKPFSL
ncbi:hypothetical protein ACFX2C_007607 [Malus domestica]